MNRKIVELDEAKLKKLAEDKKNIVYRFGERERLPADQIVPLPQVRDKIIRLYQEYCAARKTYIDQKRMITRQRWERIRYELLQKPEWKRFDYTHPLIVDRVLHPETTPKEIKALMFMIWWKSQSGDLETFKEYIFREFKMTPEQYEAKYGKTETSQR
uniref:Uncharacterized protein n=1 Tax=viral metagenome TaxID=1070528 RepID=A0A6C0BR74_9ZZZZ